MKKITFLALALNGFLAFAQIIVPTEVKTTFNQKFNSVEQVEWSKSDNTYQADFEIKETYKIATFSSKGPWIETKTTLEEANLNKNIKEKLSSKFEGIEYESVELVEALKESFYQITLSNSEGERFLVQITESGSILSSTAEDEEEDNGDYNDDDNDQ
ncbi:MAG: hypothetical protein ACI91R_000208 [Vicingaceae bacterium]|jgi:hypothetical protein